MRCMYDHRPSYEQGFVRLISFVRSRVLRECRPRAKWELQLNLQLAYRVSNERLTPKKLLRQRHLSPEKICNFKKKSSKISLARTTRQKMFKLNMKLSHHNKTYSCKLKSTLKKLSQSNHNYKTIPRNCRTIDLAQKKSYQSQSFTKKIIKLKNNHDKPFRTK